MQILVSWKMYAAQTLPGRRSVVALIIVNSDCLVQINFT